MKSRRGGGGGDEGAVATRREVVTVQQAGEGEVEENMIGAVIGLIGHEQRQSSRMLPGC